MHKHDYPLVKGMNSIALDLPGGRFTHVLLQASCEARLVGIFHGQAWLWPFPDPPTKTALCDLPPDGAPLATTRFYDGLMTTIQIEADESGALTIDFVPWKR